MDDILTFVVDGGVRREFNACHYSPSHRACNAPGAFWYPAIGGGIAVLCKQHGSHLFPTGSQRITDRAWHGGGEPVDRAHHQPRGGTMSAWTKHEREAVRDFIARTQPSNAGILVSNIEDLMPARYREAFEALFAAVRATPPDAGGRT